MVRLVALVIPLCLDTFAVSSALGLAGLRPRDRLRIGLLFALFEGGMPLIGLLVGAAAGLLVGDIADYIAVVLLIGLGLHMLLIRDQEEGAELLTRTRGFAMLGLGLTISLDELAMGFTLGLLRASALAAVLLIAGQAFVVTQLGLRLGSRLSDQVREGAEQLAGLGLLVLGLALLASRFVLLPI